MDTVKVNLALMNEKFDKNEKRLSEALERIEKNGDTVENVLRESKKRDGDIREIKKSLNEITKLLERMTRQTSHKVEGDNHLSQCLDGIEIKEESQDSQESQGIQEPASKSLSVETAWTCSSEPLGCTQGKDISESNELFLWEDECNGMTCDLTPKRVSKPNLEVLCRDEPVESWRGGQRNPSSESLKQFFTSG
jgi:myosin heavy subunit